MTKLSAAVAAIAALSVGCDAFIVSKNSGNRRSGRSPLRVTLDPTFSTPDVSTIDEIACKETASLMRRALVPVAPDVSEDGQVGVSYVHWPAEGRKKSSLPLVLIHGFDSSCLEYRRIGSKLASRGIDVYAVDLLGWGFTQLDNVASFSASAKIQSLESWANQVLKGKPYAVAGASLGGASAIEVAFANPDTIQGLILIDAQGFVDGVAPMSMLPTPLARLGVQVLKSVPLRSSANQLSFFDKETFATEDALRVGRLHCLRDGWNEALVSFMLSGGFSPSEKVSSIQAQSLVLWGRQDGILDGEEFANKFVETLPNAELQWVEECGHVPHLEKPDETADVIAEFLSSVDSGTAPARSEVGIPLGLVAGAATALVGTAVALTSQF